MEVSGHFHPRKFEEEPFSYLEKLFENFKNNFGIKLSNDPNVLTIQEQMLKHVEGMIVGPSVVSLGMGGMFHKYFMKASFRPDEIS